MTSYRNALNKRSEYSSTNMQVRPGNPEKQARCSSAIFAHFFTHFHQNLGMGCQKKLHLFNLELLFSTTQCIPQGMTGTRISRGQKAKCNLYANLTG